MTDQTNVAGRNAGRARALALSLAACGALAACGDLLDPPDGPPRSGIVEPDRTGAFEIGREIWRRGSLSSDNGGVAYVVGVSGGNVVAYAGLLPQTEVTPHPAIGSASFDGVYEITFTEYSHTETSGGGSSRGVYVRDGDTEVVIPRGSESSASSTRIWDSNETTGPFFETGNLEGISDDGTTLRVSGAFDREGNIQEGISNFRGIRGVLGGKVGADEAVGAVSGHNSRARFSGGFVVDDQPNEFFFE